MAVEPEKHEDGLNKDGAAGEVNLISQPPELKEPLASSSTSITTYNCPSGISPRRQNLEEAL